MWHFPVHASVAEEQGNLKWNKGLSIAVCWPFDAMQFGLPMSTWTQTQCTPWTQGPTGSSRILVIIELLTCDRSKVVRFHLAQLTRHKPTSTSVIHIHAFFVFACFFLLKNHWPISTIVGCPLYPHAIRGKVQTLEGLSSAALSFATPSRETLKSIYFHEILCLSF